MIYPDSTNTKSLSRELSEFLNNNLGVLDNNTAEHTRRAIDSEKTIDLSEVIISGQGNYQRDEMPISDILSGNQLTTLVRYEEVTASRPMSRSQNENSINTDFDGSDNTCESTDDAPKKHKIGNVKRLSTTSTSSSFFSSENSTILKSNRGGRRTKRVDSALFTEAENLARFGNKLVTKGTAEYDERRNKNNDAVKKCRAKLQIQQQERETRLKELTEENRKLTNTVDSLNKELSVLKGILSTMKPQCSLPSDIEEKIRKLENLVLASNHNNNFNVKS